MLKCLFIFIDQNENKVLYFTVKFPGKVRIPGAKYHVIGVASTHGQEKQPAATVLK